MRKAATGMLEQGIQVPSPASDLIPAEHQPRTYIGIGTANGGTSRSCISVGTGEDEEEGWRCMSPRLPTFAKSKSAKMRPPAGTLCLPNP